MCHSREFFSKAFDGFVHASGRLLDSIFDSFGVLNQSRDRPYPLV